MADIDIQRTRPVIWPWILGLVALVAIVWIWAAGRETPGDEMAADRTGEQQERVAPAQPARAPGAAVGTAGTEPGAVEEYVEFARGADETDARPMGPEHEYTAEGIRKLAAALESVIERAPDTNDARARFDRFREIADRIQQDPTSGRHAAMVRDAFTRAVDVLETVVPAASINQLRSTAESISPDEPLLEQRDAVHSFFDESARVMQSAGRT
jgi:hypothetical protein